MWEYAVWGLAGGLAVEGVEILRAKQARSLPWVLFGLGFYALRVVIRMGLGGSIAVALGSSGRIANPFMAMMTGASAPLLLEKASQVAKIVLTDREYPQPDESVREVNQVTITSTKTADSVVQEKTADAN